MLGFTPLASAPLADSGVQAQEYIFDAASGTFTITGQTAVFTISRAHGSGAFTLVGQDALKDISEGADQA